MSSMTASLQGCWTGLPGLRERWVRDAMVGVTGEGDGDGVAGAPVNLLHPVQVLGPRGEEGHPTWERGEQSMTSRPHAWLGLRGPVFRPMQQHNQPGRLEKQLMQEGGGWRQTSRRALAQDEGHPSTRPSLRGLFVGQPGLGVRPCCHPQGLLQAM